MPTLNPGVYLKVTPLITLVKYKTDCFDDYYYNYELEIQISDLETIVYISDKSKSSEKTRDVKLYFKKLMKCFKEPFHYLKDEELSSIAKELIKNNMTVSDVQIAFTRVRSYRSVYYKGFNQL